MIWAELILADPEEAVENLPRKRLLTIHQIPIIYCPPPRNPESLKIHPETGIRAVIFLLSADINQRKGGIL
jgi:hypothetical protein